MPGLRKGLVTRYQRGVNGSSSANGRIVNRQQTYRQSPS